MRWLHALRSRLRLLSRRGAESRMEEEIRFHVEMETESNERAGLAPAEARRRALLAFGGEDRIRERLRDERGARWLEDLASDVRHGVRMLRRSPGFAAVAVLTLALGIGASSAIFTVAYGVLLRALPWDDPDRLVRVYTSYGGDDAGSLSPPNFISLREETRAFTDIAVFDSEDVTLTGAGEARWLEGAEVSAGFFEVMGARPLHGRTFREGENLPGEDGVAVIGHALWQSLGGDPAIVGSTVMLHERPRVIVGVMPEGFDFPYDSEVWVPLQFGEGYFSADEGDRRSRWLNSVARLRSDASPAHARADLDRVARSLQARFPEGNANTRFIAAPLRDSLVAPARASLLLLAAAVGMLLLIACANVAGLFLVRSAARREELAVRAAIGAGRGRLVRQLAAESLVPGVVGGALGLVVAIWSTRLLIASPPQGLPRLDAIRVDATVVGFCLAVTLLSVLAAGVLPSLHATRSALAPQLRTVRGGARSGARLRSVLVAGEIALAVVLLSAAGLLVKSFAHMAAADPGFRTERALSFLVRLPDSYDTDIRQVAYFDALLRELRALPSVDDAGAVFRLPVAYGGFTTGVTSVDGRVPEGEPSLVYRSVTPGYFATMGIPVERGREITPTDGPDGLPVALLNASAAQRLFGDADPLGRQVAVSARDGMSLTVVGVVGDVADDRVMAATRPEIFLAYAQAPWSYMSVVVRGAGEPLTLVSDVRGALARVDADVPPREFRTLERVVDDSIARERFLSMLLAVFAGAALTLAAVGIFGLFSFSVAQRRREVAVRAALGARRTDLLRMVLLEALRLAGTGTLIGVIGAAALARMIESQLYGVRALDPLTFAVAVALLGGTALVASALPARRAARTEPMIALRSE